MSKDFAQLKTQENLNNSLQNDFKHGTELVTKENNNWKNTYLTNSFNLLN